MMISPWCATRTDRGQCTSRASPIEAQNSEEERMTYVNFKFAVDSDGLALITWDMPGRSMNVIDQKVMAELDAIVEKVATDAAIKGAVVTSGKDTFSGGADLTTLDSLGDTFKQMARSQGEEAAVAKLFEESRRLSLLYRRLETCGKPWV